MDSETREVMDRFERYFGLINLALEESKARDIGLERRQDAFERRQESFEELLSAFRNETRERFMSVDEQFRTLTLRSQQFEVRIEEVLGVVTRDVSSLKEQTGQLTNRMKNVEIGIGDLNSRVDGLADEVRQRFRYRGA